MNTNNRHTGLRTPTQICDPATGRSMMLVMFETVSAYSGLDRHSFQSG
jgi:hypothetical protein